MSDLGTRAPLREVARAKPNEPAPLSPLPEHDGASADAAGADSQAASAAKYRRRVLLTLGAIGLALGLYWASGYVFAYTDDAYVTSDLVSVAPYISGRVVAVPIVDNQTVTKGSVLAEIDPTPFQLALAQKQAKRTEAEAQLAVDRDLIASAQAQRDNTAARERLASDNLRRATPVAAAGFVSRQALDTATAQVQEAKAALADAETTIAKAQQTLALHQATVATITTEIAVTQWQLDQTKLLAPTDGTITNLTLRVGDQAVENTPLIGLVDAHAWRIFRQLQGNRDPPYASRRHGLGLARRLPVARASRDDPGHSARHQPRADRAQAPALCRADDGLDPSAAALSGNVGIAGPESRHRPAHGLRRPHIDHLLRRGDAARDPERARH